MKTRISLASLIGLAGGLLFCQAPSAWADEPPLWMVGKFRTYNQKYRTNVLITIREDGSVIAKSKPDSAKTVIQRGTFEDRKLILDGLTFDMHWRRGGFSLIQRNDPDNTADYVRMDDYGDRFEKVQRILNDAIRTPEAGYRTPQWLPGVWRGTNHKYHARVNIHIANDGRLTAIGKFQDGHETVQRGSYQDGKLVIDGERYDIIRRDGGLRFRQVDEQDNVIDVSQYGGDFGRDPEIDVPPSWLVSVFTGYNRKYDADVRIEIQPSGKVVSRVTHDGKTTTSVGSYRRGRIRIIGGASYDVERASDGVRLINIDDERDAELYVRGRDLPRR